MRRLQVAPAVTMLLTQQLHCRLRSELQTIKQRLDKHKGAAEALHHKEATLRVQQQEAQRQLQAVPQHALDYMQGGTTEEECRKHIEEERPCCPACIAAVARSSPCQ